jgi:sugar (pentulose or hexulose) kinase
LKASVLGVPVTVPDIVEATAMGAALLAGIGSGVYGSRSEAAEISKSLGERVFEPDPAAARHYGEVYDRIYLPALADHERYDREYEKIQNEMA